LNNDEAPGLQPHGTHYRLPFPKGGWIMRLGMRPLTIAACAVAFGFVRPAVADAIDGDWCQADGKRM